MPKYPVAKSYRHWESSRPRNLVQSNQASSSSDGPNNQMQVATRAATAHPSGSGDQTLPPTPNVHNWRPKPLVDLETHVTSLAGTTDLTECVMWTFSSRGHRAKTHLIFDNTKHKIWAWCQIAHDWFMGCELARCNICSDERAVAKDS